MNYTLDGFLMENKKKNKSLFKKNIDNWFSTGFFFCYSAHNSKPTPPLAVNENIFDDLLQNGGF